MVKNPPANAGDIRDTGLILHRRSPGGGNGNPCQYSCLENSMDGGAWRGYTPWGRKELGMTERAHTDTHPWLRHVTQRANHHRTVLVISEFWWYTQAVSVLRLTLLR